jgi:peptidyl-prolyl cis-trans isomerase A (cyclophilin A)
MARTNVVDSATSQFFVNLTDNDFLNHQGPANFGYAVFGKVIEGMDTIDRIAKQRTGNRNGHGDVPATDIVILSARRVEAGK